MARTEYTARQGDCISSIAYAHGFFWETVWNHAQNSDLKRQRKDPNVLCPGDKVFIPEKEERQESCSCEQNHRFRLKGVPAKMKVRLLLDDKPRANEKFRLYVDDVLIKEGQTDADGFIEENIPPDVVAGEIVVVDEDGNEDHYPFNFGTVDPLETDEGVRQRLADLGFDALDDYEASIKAFQQKEGLPVSGTMDDATRSQLKERFGQ